MNPQDAIDFSREAIMTCMKVGGPILIAGLLIGLLVGVFQAMTQIQDQTVSFVPKILLLLVMIGLCLPWLTDQMLDFAKQSFETPMMHWEGNEQVSIDFGATTSSPAQPAASLNPYYQQPADRPKFKPATTLPPNTASTIRPDGNAQVMNASFERVQFPANSRASTNSSSLDAIKLAPVSNLQETTQPKSPFILPHYRFSKVPKTDIDG